jgi:hypothetical protein
MTTVIEWEIEWNRQRTGRTIGVKDSKSNTLSITLVRASDADEQREQ